MTNVHLWDLVHRSNKNKAVIFITTRVHKPTYCVEPELKPGSGNGCAADCDGAANNLIA